MVTQGRGPRGVVVAAAIAGRTAAPPGRAHQAAIAGRVDEVDTWIAEQRDALGIPGVAAGFVVDGEVMLASGHGVTQVDGGQRVTGDTPFVVASVGKAVTALAVGRLVDGGPVAFDDPVLLGGITLGVCWGIVRTIVVTVARPPTHGRDDLGGGGMTNVVDEERRVWEEVGATPVVHRFDLARVGTTVRVLEVGSGPPAVFLHGASVAGTSWADLAAALPDVRCLLVDRPGCGGSDPLPGKVDLEGLLAVGDHLVADVLDELGLASAAVVATSRGGLEALRGAAAHPDRVERLLLFGWCLGAPGTHAPWWIRAGALPGAGRMMAAVPMSRRNVAMSLRRFGLDRALDEGGMSDAALDWLVALYRDTDTLRHESAISTALLTLRDGWRDVVPRDRLAAVRAPARIVWGDEDPFGDEANARRLAHALADADLHVLDRAGHAPWLDRLATCADLARAFLVGHDETD